MDSVAVMEMRFDGGRPAPSSGWFVQERSTKPMKEVSPAVGSGNVYVSKAAAVAETNKAVAEAVATNKAVVEAGKTKPAEGKKKTKTMRVKQAYIDLLLKKYPFKPFPWEPEVCEKTMPDPVLRERLLNLMSPAVAIMKASRDNDEAIVKQYLAQGYAEEEVEVDEEEA